MPLSSPYLATTDRYERTTHGWVDAPWPDAFAITVRIADPWVAVDMMAHTTPSPEYAIRAAQGQILVGERERVEPALSEAIPKLAGISMTSGFTRSVAGTLGSRPGAQYFIGAAVEVARLARQVTRMPEALVRDRLAEGAVGFWRLDMEGWVDIPSSCYTYRAESEALFSEREVKPAATAALYAPPVGATHVFNRTKVARLERRDGRLLLTHSMFDEVHSFQIWYAVDLATGAIVDAGSITPRLPYFSICNDPQRNIHGLIGQTIGPELRKRIGGLIGGSSGCAQLYDLTADLLKLLSFE
ncbi:MAG: DUF2889 domain-containing protein [Candidatus Rokubacteria bacterium]|nr:DUF2889 domain-containing protein [Candidatus Rokubacteria bacterium]